LIQATIFGPSHLIPAVGSKTPPLFTYEVQIAWTLATLRIEAGVRGTSPSCEPSNAVRYTNGLNVEPGWRRALTARPDQFVQALTENLFTYALGRSTDYRDMPAVRKIVHSAEADKYRFESIVMGVISSDAFRKREASSTNPSQSAAK